MGTFGELLQTPTLAPPLDPVIEILAESDRLSPNGERFSDN